jgi:hypothetical protein
MLSAIRSFKLRDLTFRTSGSEWGQPLYLFDEPVELPGINYFGKCLDNQLLSPAAYDLLAQELHGFACRPPRLVRPLVRHGIVDVDDADDLRK